MAELLNSIKENLSQLVALPSVSSTDPGLDQGNLSVAQCLGNWGEDLGFQVVLQPVIAAQDKVNLIARFNPRAEDPATSMVLAGHIDTVPADDKQWTHNPWSLTDIPGAWQGLGVSDMKGFPALVMALLKQWKTENRLGHLARPLTLVFTADEESTMAGGRALQELNEPLGSFCLIGEPTGLDLVHCHKGMLTAQVTIEGSAAHSSRPDLGLNAIEGMRLVLDALDKYRKQLGREYQNPSFELPSPTLNFGALHGGDAPNRVADACTLKLDVRLLQGMDPEGIQAELKALVAAALADSPFEKFSVAPLFDGVGYFETPAASPFVQTMSQLTGKAPATIDFCTEGPFFNALGMESVIYGPGNVGQIHRPNECLNPAELLEVASVLEALLLNPH